MKISVVRRTSARLVVLASIVAGCGPFAPEPRPALPTGEASRPRPSARPVERDPAGEAEAQAAPERAVPEPPVSAGAGYEGPTGAIAGLVSFKGEPPARKELAVGGTPGCEHDEPVLSELVIVNDGKLANVFVYVSKGIKEWSGELPDPLTLDQRGCIYQPHVSGAMVGQTVLAANSDPLAHNVHVIAKRNNSPNKTQSAGMKPLELVFEREEVPVILVCDIHPWMKAYVCVQDHPFFAVSAADGSFRIDGLPPGEYTLGAWHEKYGKQKSDKVTVDAGGEAAVRFQYP